MMDLKSLTTFIQVAELCSFTRAAEKLGYSQPTISVQIRQLEEELGIKLFDRIGHTVRLTEKGRDVLPYAQRICHMCQKMVLQGETVEDVQGTIRLGMADSLCSVLINNGFLHFRKRYPGISLKITAAGTDELFRLLDHNEVDMVCTLDSHIYNTNYIIANEEQVNVHFVVAANHPLAQMRKIFKEDLLEQPFLLTEKGMSYRRQLEDWLAQDSQEIQPILEIGSADLICKLVEQGAGVSFLPDYVTAAAVLRGSLVRLQVEGFEANLWKQLLYHRDKWISPQIKAVIQHLSNIPLESLSLEERL